MKCGVYIQLFYNGAALYYAPSFAQLWLCWNKTFDWKIRVMLPDHRDVHETSLLMRSVLAPYPYAAWCRRKSIRVLVWSGTVSSMARR